MNICSADHEEIVHEGRRCPICELVGDLKNDLNNAQKRIIELEDEIESLKWPASK